MNLAFHDIRHHAGRFVATSAVIGLLFTVVLAMAGIYQGLVDDATVLLDRMHADLWVVQRGTRGPFADPSRLDPSLELRVAAVPGVVSARAFTTQVLQRDHGDRQLRFALVGLSFPEDRGEGLSITQGRPLAQAHGDLIADASLGVAIGEVLRLGRDDYRVVGLTRQLLASGGDAVVFATLSDTQRILADDSSDALIAERERRVARLRETDLGRSLPLLEDLAVDPRWTFPAIAAPPINAVLVQVTPARLEEVRAALGRWSDVSVYTMGDEEQLVLQGMVAKARMQLGLFAVILVVTSSLLLAAVLYTLTLEKKHEIAVLKLLGARAMRIVALVVQQAWVMAFLGYAIALFLGNEAFPHFPRRVVLTETSVVGVGLLLLVVSTLASIAGVVYALRVDPGPVLELTMEALRAEHLEKRYGEGETEVWALRGVDLTLQGGEVVALLGPSGAGKSTLIKILGLVTRATRGDLWMDGERVLDDGTPVADVGDLRRSHLGFVFQKPNLIPFLNARRNEEIACEIGERFEPRARADELLEYLGLGHRKNAYPHTLSGGEQQRVAIARALANAPSLILADEPTAALDKERGRAVMELLARVAHEQGTAVVVVTHDHRSLDVFDATYEMEDGRLSGPVPRAASAE